MAVTEYLWLELIWLIDWWAGIKVLSKFHQCYVLIVVINEVLFHLMLAL